MPNHPLFNQLCKNALVFLTELGFRNYHSANTKMSFISENNKIVITIIHGGYDMPQVFFGNKNNLFVTCFIGLLEEYINESISIYNKHKALKSFYDLKYEYDVLKTYYFQIESIINSPKEFLKWEKEKFFES